MNETEIIIFGLIVLSTFLILYSFYNIIFDKMYYNKITEGKITEVKEVYIKRNILLKFILIPIILLSLGNYLIDYWTYQFRYNYIVDNVKYTSSNVKHMSYQYSSKDKLQQASFPVYKHSIVKVRYKENKPDKSILILKSNDDKFHLIFLVIGIITILFSILLLLSIK